MRGQLPSLQQLETFCLFGRSSWGGRLWLSVDRCSFTASEDPGPTLHLALGWSPCLYLSNQLVIWQPQYSNGFKKSYYFTVYLAFLWSSISLKKWTAWQLSVKFYLGQNEDYSSGDSMSDSSKQLLQRARKEGQYICSFGEGGAHAIKYLFFVEVFCLSHEGYY